MANIKQTALYLAYFTVGYNLLEGLISILAGRHIGSISLIGFGLDSFIESFSSVVLIWRFTKIIPEEKEHEFEEKAVKLIAGTFFILGAYILFQSIQKLLNHEGPEQSGIGIIIAIVSIIVMTGLYKLKNRFGRKHHLPSLVADSKQTLACIMMSFALLIGLVPNFLFGIWWTRCSCRNCHSGISF